MGIQSKDDNKSSSFNSKPKKQLKVKSPTVTSTLDMFDINAKQAKKDIDSIFDYATKSTTKFNNRLKALEDQKERLEEDQKERLKAIEEGLEEGRKANIEKMIEKEKANIEKRIEKEKANIEKRIEKERFKKLRR